MPNREHPDIMLTDFIRDRFAVWSENHRPFNYIDLTPMNPIIKVEWVTALESEDYDQVSGFLKVAVMQKVDGQRFAYCCWGVLCEIQHVPSSEANSEDHHSSRGEVWEFDFADTEDGTEIPPWYWTDRFGVPQPVVNALAEANDHGYTFKEIAGWVREYL